MNDETAVATYPIQERAPRFVNGVMIDRDRVLATMEQLKPGAAFVIPAAELTDSAGKYRTRRCTWTLYKLAAKAGIRISCKKLPEGLRVRRFARGEKKK